MFTFLYRALHIHVCHMICSLKSNSVWLCVDILFFIKFTEWREGRSEADWQFSCCQVQYLHSHGACQQWITIWLLFTHKIPYTDSNDKIDVLLSVERGDRPPIPPTLPPSHDNSTTFWESAGKKTHIGVQVLMMLSTGCIVVWNVAWYTNAQEGSMNFSLQLTSYLWQDTECTFGI